MKFLLYIIVLSSTSVWGFNNSCCESGRVMLKRKTTCWEPETNSTVNIHLNCPKRNKQKLNYTIDDKGTLIFYYYVVLLQENRRIELPFGKYCIGQQTVLNDTKLEKTENAVVYCLDDESDDPVTTDVKAYCMIVSAIFLALTAMVYLLLPEIRDLLGKSIINYCVSSALGFMLLIIMSLMEYSDMKLCAVRGFLTYFFIVASFFWTNAISIQIIISMKRPYLYDRGWQEFVRYAIYAWGCAGALTLCVVIANYYPGDHKRPGIGLMHCWFVDNHHVYYLYSVMGVIIIANTVIFSWCLYHLWSQSFNSSHIKAVKYKCMLSLRLFLLMGIPWIFEIISSLTESGIVTAILDVFTTLQGLLTFVVLVLLRQRALKAMLKHGWLCCLSPSVEKHLALVEDVEDIAEHTVDYRLDDQKK
ncbi:G-protein coupled receptor Mth2-like [Plodia interpunctella]|uniref:G-protein coupled receptor Mth2-like n=1 Tax=Plodia interpunctella TaxID=58824 RepID=UPI002367AD9D|nr:G-protein coupled receptor Mth2-like [Plodia interpunctella]